MSELFRSENVVARIVPGADPDRCVITFDNYGIGHGFERQGFGEAFLEARGITAIHVMGRREDWYQYAEMPEVSAAVRHAVAPFSRIMTYGSSMGGYAALRFADAMGANAALAMSPQYSLDPEAGVTDRRWSQDTNRIGWRPELRGPIHCDFKPVVVYDPVGPDGWHGRRVAQDLPIDAIRLPHTAHPVTTYLGEVGLLAPLVFETLDGVLDAHAFEAKARRLRGTSGVYLGELSGLQPAHRPRTAIGLARKALEVAPGHVHGMLALARRLTELGDHDEALALHEKIQAVAYGAHVYLVHYGEALLKAGQTEPGRAIADRIIAEAPDQAHLHVWHALALGSVGDYVTAMRSVETAMTLDPENAAYLKVHRKLRRADAEVRARARRDVWMKRVRRIRRAVIG